ncbi:MAG: multicopper oxidase domain-containing protein, partial [Bacteroidetes bacterium]|nr:multicopper oxidase domain-containing protein [Bacteroidota bacterium]
MHPDIHQDRPGKCPKCGMPLVKEKNTKAGNTPGLLLTDTSTIKSDSDSVAIYSCPMHPEIQSSQPSRCPKCGMKLEIKEGMGGQMHSDSNTTHQHNKQGMEMGNGAKTVLPAFNIIENNEPPKTVRYDLYINDTIVNFGKRKRRAIAVNGQIPMPVLTFTEGDTAEIYVHNLMNEETSLHWHGLILPNRYDGVPNLTQMPIKPHSTHIYRFPIVQHGTHWYHSHTKLQEQIGMYGLFIMNKRKEWDIPTVPVIISEWADMKPEEIDRSLHSANDWFSVKKESTQSWAEAIKKGYFKTKFVNEWKRMNAMDLTDVYYDNFLLNGKNQLELSQYKPGDKVRLRIANGGASDYFWLTYAGGKITVVATDGNDVAPVEVDRLIIAVSETYDVIVTIPGNDKSYEFLVTPEDRTKSASMWLGSGEKVYAKKMDRPKYFAGMKMMNAMMDMKGNLIEMNGMKMQNQVMDMNTVMYPEITGPERPDKRMKKYEMSMMDSSHINHDMGNMGNMSNSSADIVTLNYSMLRSPEKTTLLQGPMRELKFDLTGNMNRYVWTMDNKTVSESDKVLIRKGENLRIILYNNSMMRHPMHLHGHDFRVLNGQGEYAPMKNVIDIMPMERDTIEFAATESGDWFFHCHILY